MTPEEYQAAYKQATGRDLVPTPIKPMKPIIPIEVSIRAGIGSLLFLFACLIALFVGR